MKKVRSLPSESLAKMCNDIQCGYTNNESTLDHLNALAVIQDSSIQRRLLEELVRKYVDLEKRVDTLLKNTLPETVVDEIKDFGKFQPRAYDCTILFADMVGFTKLAERILGEELIAFLHRLFAGMDDLTIRFRGTKIKTIGDAYMAVFGAPRAYEDHAVSAVRTARAFLDLTKNLGEQWGQDIQIRIGIHTGTVMAGVVGMERMQFDVFGDNVNIASRYESSGEKGRINVSAETFRRTCSSFHYEERGEIALKNKARMKAYFVLGEKA